MKIGIYGAGQFCNHVNTEIPFIAVDGGILSLQKLNITPQYIIGDFDSANIDLVYGLKNVIQLPCRKDYTDTEVAIQEAIKLGYNEIELYGVTGGRLDHFFAICRILLKYKDINISVIDDINNIKILKQGSHIIEKKNYDYISFFSVKDTYISVSGVAYPLKDYKLVYNDALCVSNEILENTCYFECNDTIFCIQSKKGGF